MDMIVQCVEGELGVQATSLGNQEWKKLASFIRTEHEAGRWSGPLILVGHSIGADDQVRVAKRLNAAQVPVEDRWAIIAYIRALQLSQNGTINDLPPDMRAKLAGGAQ